MVSTRKAVVAIATCALMAGCDYPTEPPLIQQRWIVPVDETSMAGGELLPTGVTVDGSTFDIAVDDIVSGEALGILCPVCTVFDGLGFEVTVPPFSGTFSASGALPDDVLSATITGGSIELAISNGLSFDPLENGGTMTVEVRNGVGGNLLGSRVLGGIGFLPSGVMSTFEVTLVPGTVDAPLVTSVVVNAPGGQQALINTSERIDVTARTLSLLVGEVIVDVAGQVVDFDPIALDVEGFDTDLTERIVSGTIVLDVANPWAVSLSGSVDIGPTSKSFSLPATGTSTIRLEYTGADLRSFLGQSGIIFSGSGTANGAAVTIVPGQTMTLEATLDFTLEIG